MGSIRKQASTGFHPENPHQGPYDFERLAAGAPSLRAHLTEKPDGSGTCIRFSDPEAVRALNQAILQVDYGIDHWDLPAGCLCPTIPGRVDYLYHLRSLIGNSDSDLTLLDIGTGASGVYALLGAARFRWRIIASEAHAPSLAHLQTIVRQHPHLEPLIDLRFQAKPHQILHHVLQPDDRVSATVCNPPYYESIESAHRAHQHKHRAHLRRCLPTDAERRSTQGWHRELCFPEGEVGFVGQLVQESVAFRTQVKWFTSLLSRASSIKRLLPLFEAAHPLEVRILPMQHGNKRSRILAWRFQ